MSLPKKILLLVLLLIVFMAVCVYTKIGQFTDEFSTSTPQEATNQVTQPLQNEETPPLTPEETLKKIDEPLVEDEEKKGEETQKNIEKIIEQNFEEKNKQTQPLLSKENIQEQINSVLENNSIMFQRMSYNVTTQSQDTVEKIAQILIQNPQIKIEIAGHTDAKGDDSFNQMISEQRANSVKNLLIALGVEENRLSAKGYGETMPLVPNDKEGYSLTNRRVEFNIIEE
ncbi:MAG: OmpA family protein [Arcobacteraceae bacterium]|nr:OmpA family protein [Arcobacteraceae bacterium]